MENLNPWEIAVVVCGAILALAGAIVTIGNAAEKIIKVVRAAKAPEKKQDDEIQDIKNRLDKVERKLDKDKSAIEDNRQCNHVLIKSMFALLEHGINGNNIDPMKEAKKDVEEYLINH